MNIALITDDFYPSTGGLATTLKNFNHQFKKLKENLFIFNNSYESENCFKIIYSTLGMKALKNRDKKFFFYYVKLLIMILFFFRTIKLMDRIKLVLYYCFFPRNFVNRIESIKNLIIYFKKNKLDVIITANSLYPLFYGFIISKWFNKPLLNLAHGDDFSTKFPSNLHSILFKNIQSIVLSNKIMERLFLKIYNVQKEKLEIIYRGVNAEQMLVSESKEALRNELNLSQDHFIVLTVCRIHRRKGLETSINAIKQIYEENPKLPLKYIIIGTGPEEKKFQDLVSNLNLSDNIKLLGAVDDEARNKYYKASDIFVLVPTIQKGSIEGFGIVYIEANYYKLPVIGSLSGGIKEAIIEGKTGYLIEPNNMEKLKERILSLYNNNELRKEFGEYGYKRVMDNYSWEKIAKSYQKLLKKLIKD